MNSQGTWIIPAKVTHLPDGSTLLKPCPAILRSTASQTTVLTGVHRKTLAALADCGLIRRERPSPNQSFYYPADVEALLRQTREDPDFWNEVRTKAYLRGECLKSSTPRI